MVKALITKLLKNLPFLLAILLLPALIFGCAQGKVDPFDRQTGATQKEIRDVFFGDKSKKNADKKAANSAAAEKSNSIPQSSRMIAIPSLPKINSQKLISFSVTDQVPLKDVLIELAKAAKLDIDLDPNIEGGVIINAKNRPLLEILDRICDMGNLRYTLVNNRLHVERDLPFAKNYSLDFLIDGDLWASVENNILALINDKTNAKSESSGGSVSSNRLSNIMTIFASQKNHIKVANYLEQVRKSSSAQVLIEAKVVEVTLNDNYKTGIDWSSSTRDFGQIKNNGILLTTANSTGTQSTLGNVASWVMPSKFFSGNLNATINALEEFGSVKAISSPRINALNNQKATLNFTKKLIYFTNEASTNTTTAGTTSNAASTVTSTKNEELTGTELTITPAIDLASGEITLNVKPKITIQTDTVTQKIFVPLTSTDSTGKQTTTNQEIDSQIPIVNTRELNTIAKIQSGSVLVIGGVMTESTANNDSGVPFLSRIPLLGYLFKSVSKVSSVTETVIFIKATIVGTGEGVSKYDRTIHNTFTSSDRPFLNSN
ncbi:MAG: hypothetical protein V4612_05860 [Pseudomonadota bacterium]